jgi:hypothetical protein
MRDDLIPRPSFTIRSNDIEECAWMTVAVGDKAPPFLFRDATGRGEVKLADFEGKPVVLAFYALAFTGG